MVIGKEKRQFYEKNDEKTKIINIRLLA